MIMRSKAFRSDLERYAESLNLLSLRICEYCTIPGVYPLPAN